MPPRPFLISSITRSVGSQRSAQRGRPVLLRLSVCPAHSVNLLSSSVSSVGFSQTLVAISSDPIKLPSVVSLLKPEADTIPMDSIAWDVQPLPLFSVESSARRYSRQRLTSSS